MTGAELAKLTGLSRQVVNYWKEQLIQEGLTSKGSTGLTKYSPEAIEWLKSRAKNKKGTQGGGQHRNRYLMSKLEKEGLEPIDVFYSKDRIQGVKGWFYVRIGVEKPLYLGKNYSQACKNISYSTSLE